MQFLKIEEKDNISDTQKGLGLLINPNAISYICTSLDGFANHTNITMIDGRVFKVGINYRDLKNKLESVTLENL